MNTTRFLIIVTASLFFLTPALADENLDSVQLLYVQNSHDVSVEKGRITLKKISPTTIFFFGSSQTDRRSHDDKRFCR